MARRTRLVVVTVVVVAALVGIAVAGRALWHTAKNHFTADSCSFGGYDLDPSQTSVAATMIGEVTKYRIASSGAALPPRASVLVLAAAMQESKLTNIPPGEGDRDSVGVLQQRPSQGWGGGSAAKLTDVGEATKEFLDALVKIENWQTLPLATAIQEVQISADGSLYAQHEAISQVLADVLTGRTPAGLTCDFGKPTEVAPAATVATQAAKELGITTPKASDTGTVTVSGAHWQTAAWFVANADRLGIASVGYDGKRWTPGTGWKTSQDPATAVTATMAKV